MSETNSKSNKSIIPYGNGAWIYDKIWSGDLPDGTITVKKNHIKPGLFRDAITEYNNKATGFPITQVFPYGGDIEMYCRGSGESKTSDACNKDSLLITFPGSDLTKNGVYKGDHFVGLKSFKAYLGIPKVEQNIVVIDGRVDNIKEGEYDYLDYLNKLDNDEAKLFADIISKAICGNDKVDGVQFDVEPFSFTGEGGSVTGAGQKYLYTQITKNFAGWNGHADDVTGINPDPSTDPLGCVSENHPNGRIFSVFTFAKAVTDEVKEVFLRHGNGYIVDSLYDLGKLPGGQLNSIYNFTKYAAQEIKDIKATGVPYQFAIPLAASAHEFETKDVTPPIGIGEGNQTKDVTPPGIGEGNQIEYVRAVMNLINPTTLQAEDPNFKGINIWSWNQKMFWHGDEYTPASPPQNTLDFLNSFMDGSTSHDEL